MANLYNNPLNSLNQAQTISETIQNAGQIFSPLNTMQAGLLAAKQKEIEANIANNAKELDLKAPVYAGQAANQQSQAGYHNAQSRMVETQTKGLIDAQNNQAQVPGAVQQLFNVDTPTAKAMSVIGIAQGAPNGANPHLAESLNATAGSRMILQNPNDTAAAYTAQNLRGKPMAMTDVANPEQLGQRLKQQQDYKLQQIELQNAGKGGTTKNPFQTPGALSRADKDTGILESAFDRQYKGADPAIRSQAVTHAQEIFQSGKVPNADAALAQSVADLFGGMVDNPNKHWYNPGTWFDASKVPANGVAPQAPAAVAPKAAVPAPQAAPQAAAPAGNSAAILAQARQAIQAGKDPNAVRARLRQMGVDDSGL